MAEKGAHFLDGLKDLQKRHTEIGDVDGLGLALRAEICDDDGFTPNKALLDQMVDIGLAGELEHDGKKIGLVLDVGGYYKNVITFAPSLHITQRGDRPGHGAARSAADQGQESDVRHHRGAQAPRLLSAGLSRVIPMQGMCDNGDAHASPYFFGACKPPCRSAPSAREALRRRRHEGFSRTGCAPTRNSRTGCVPTFSR